MASQEYTVAGVRVIFPHRAYGSQIAYMGKVLTALKTAYSTGHGNALLESPTGSGKTLALLCATLAWQQHCNEKCTTDFSAHSPSEAAAASIDTRENHLLTGGGFIPDPGTPGCENANEAGPLVPVLPFVKRKAPKIIYTTRTHSQIAQVVQELHKTNYRVPMAVLAARKHYCTNDTVCKKKNFDEDCKLRLKAEENRANYQTPIRSKPNQEPNDGCSQFRNVNRLRMHPSLQQGGINQVHDIEDLVGIGRKVKGCAYYASRALAETAQIIFCPYNYVVDPMIRSAMQIDIKGSIVIMDEAHNIEDVAREAGSFTVQVSDLADVRAELVELISQATEDETRATYEPLLEMLEGMLVWAKFQENSLQRVDSSTNASWWCGSKALDELRKAGIRLELFPTLQQCCRQAIKAASDLKPKICPPSGPAAIILEGLFCVLNFMLGQTARRMDDYQLVVKKSSKFGDGRGSAERVFTISFWCLNPAVVFEELGAKSQSIILTSGTLFPMESFASELGVNFVTQIEAPHVVDMTKQVWAVAIGEGPGRVTLNASYKYTDKQEFQDGLGVAMLDILKVIPDGVLVFFPSYKLVEKLVNRWKYTGQWKHLQAEKQLFVEPRSSHDAFEEVLSQYYGAVNGVKSLGSMSKSRFKSAQAAEARLSMPRNARNTNGAVFFAVFRGKVSEGLNFADQNARAVITVGIPYPSIMDLQVKLKMQYNTRNKYAKALLGGDEWYCQQAFRALNQAVGRCIRHRNDYGAIILLDERLQKQDNLKYMSKWLRSSVQRVDNFQHSLTELQSFFQNMQKTPKEDIPLPISSNTLEPLNSLGGHAPQHPRVDQDTVWEPELKEVLCARSKFHNETEPETKLANPSLANDSSPLLPCRRKLPASSSGRRPRFSAGVMKMHRPSRGQDGESDEGDDFICTQAPTTILDRDRSPGPEMMTTDSSLCSRTCGGSTPCVSQSGESDCCQGSLYYQFSLSEPHNWVRLGVSEEGQLDERALHLADSPCTELLVPAPAKPKLKLPRR